MYLASTPLLHHVVQVVTPSLLIAPIIFSAAYGPPKGGNPFGVMSPVDSAIGSGVTSGVTTNAHSAVAEGDLEDFKDEEPGSAGFPPYNQPPPFPEQQARGT